MNIEFPSLPQALVQLIDACNDPERDIASVGRIVSRDASLAARVLRLANSAFLGSRSSFADIGQAVIYLGMDTLRNLAISTIVHDTFAKTANQNNSKMEEFWFHSLFCAILAKELAERNHYQDPSEAYLTGLLHDIGKCILRTRFPDKYHRVDEMSSEATSQKEAELFGISHADAGAQLILHWHLEEHIAEPIRIHHSILDSQNTPEELPLILSLANLLTEDVSEQACRLAKQLTAKSGEKLNKAALMDIREEMYTTVQSVATSLGITISEPVPAQPPSTPKDVSRNKQLLEKTEDIAQLLGMLDNLLRAENRNRACLVVEETILLLYGIEHSLILIPDDTNQGYTGVGSQRNFLIQRSEKELFVTHPLPDLGEDRSAGLPFLLHRHNLGSVSPWHTLFELSHCQTLLFQQFLIEEGLHGFLLLALPGKHIDNFKELYGNGLHHLAAHIGSWLRLDLIKQQHASKLAQEQISIMKSVARSLSHEIASPLAAIRNYIFLVKNRCDPKLKISEELDRIDNEIERIGKITTQLRELSPHSPEESGQKVDLNDLVSDTVQFFQQGLENSGNVRITFLPCNTLPTIICNPDAIRQILTNLISNSLDAIEAQGNITISLECTHKPDGTGEISVTVADNGCGVGNSMLSKLFTPGFTTKVGHTGLGLTIVKKLANDLGGEINFDNNRDHGTAFSLHLPWPPG